MGENNRFWGYRIKNDIAEYFYSELEKGRLRQGWGYEPEHDLTNDFIADDGARRNKPIYQNVKKDDYLIIPHLPSYDYVTIAQATEDFDKGYQFSIDKDNDNDFGHIFPAKYCTHFAKSNINVGSNIKSTLKCISRFWNADQCKDEIINILSKDPSELVDSSDFSQRIDAAISEVFKEEVFADALFTSFRGKFNASDWEFVLCEGFKKILPSNVTVETTANREEINHGCDIFIKIPGIFQVTYVIAIQVKDYQGTVSVDVIDQINRVDDYLKENEPNTVLIDKYIIIVDADSSDNDKFILAANEQNIRLIFKKELKTLLSQMAKSTIGLQSML